MIVYDPEGNAHNKEPIDVLECVSRLGWTTVPPVKTEAIEPTDNTPETGTKGSKK